MLHTLMNQLNDQLAHPAKPSLIQVISLNQKVNSLLAICNERRLKHESVDDILPMLDRISAHYTAHYPVCTTAH